VPRRWPQPGSLDRARRRYHGGSPGHHGLQAGRDPYEGQNLVDRAFLRRLLAIAGLVLAAMWLLMVLIGGPPPPGWLPPTSLVLTAAAIALF